MVPGQVSASMELLYAKEPATAEVKEISHHGSWIKLHACPPVTHLTLEETPETGKCSSWGGQLSNRRGSQTLPRHKSQE